jgi:hypothetical protein
VLSGSDLCPTLCSSALRPPISLGADRIVRLASEAAFSGIAIDASTPLPLLRKVALEALRAGVPVGLCAAPLPVEELPKGRRLPHLGAYEDPEERLAAVKLGRQTLAAAGELSIPVVTVDLGPVPLRIPEAPVRLYFARRELDEGEPGYRHLRRALDERKARAIAIFDACRAALEPLLESAGQRGTVLALAIATSPWQVPSPREAQLLLQEFAGAPLALQLSPARRAVLARLRLGGPAERWDELARSARVLEATDQVGLADDLLLGLGELELRIPAGAPLTLPGMITGPSESPFKEILRARRRLEEAFAARPRPDGERKGEVTSPGR